MATRDDFSASTKRLLSERVGFRCSNPDCRLHTSGPSADPSSSVNIGVAAHITAAAPGGPRYDSSLSGDERKGLQNGIWLCQNCAKLIDSDSDFYTEELLYGWKNQAETQAAKSLQHATESIIASGGQGSNVISAILTNQVEYLATKLANLTEKHLSEMRMAWREGRRAEAANWLRELKVDSHAWVALPSEIRAELLCFEGSLMLDLGNLVRAKQCLAEARDLSSPTSAARLQALIAFREEGAEAAEQLLVGYEDIDTINLRAGLLLESGQIASCLSLLSEVQGNSETFRVRALAYLRSKEMDKAQLNIQKAYELHPSWVDIRYAKAVTDYLSALSPAALPDRLVAWPIPVDWRLIKGDSESKKRLQDAAREFDALATNNLEGTDEQQRLQIWALACLANDLELQEKANDYCKGILQENPASYPAISWALARGYEIDLRQSRVALEESIQQEPDNSDHCLALILCYHRLQRFDDALRILTETEAQFRDNDQFSVWLFWRIRVLSAMGDKDAVEQLTVEFGDDPNMPEVQSALLLVDMEADEWSAVAEHYRNVYQTTGDPIAQLNFCEALEQEGQWAAIADQADSLVRNIDTAGILQFVVIAAYNAHRPELCLRLLDNYRGRFADSQLPPFLRRIRIASQQALGLLPSAILEAETLWREEQTVDDLWRLISLYFWTGDVKNAAIAARYLRGLPDVTTEQLLQVVNLVLHEDAGLAIDLWHTAFRQGIPDLMVGDAIFTGFQLGAEGSEEMRSLSQRMVELGHREEAGIFVKQAHDLIPFLREQAEHQKSVENGYWEARVPVHLTDWSLPHLYHINLLNNSEQLTPFQKTVLLARYGGKRLEEGFREILPQWRLNLDITAILMAAHFNILDAVEKAFAPLRIPPDVIPALIQMREKLIPHQPARIHLQQEVLRYIDTGRINVVDYTKPSDTSDIKLIDALGGDWVAFYEIAAQNEGFLVDFLPLRKRDLSGPLSDLPEEIDERVVNTRSIFEALRQSGHISDYDYLVALATLGSEGQTPASRTIPPTGANLYFEGNVIESLAAGKVLHVAATSFQLYLDKRYAQQLRLGASALADQNLAVAWLDSLLDRIRNGIQAGSYEIIPVNSATETIFSQAKPANLTERCLLALLKSDLVDEDVIWIDDRAISAYLHRDTAPIIGINEVLKALVAAGTLAQNDYYRKLHQLRAANVRYIPVQTDELRYFLWQARIENGEFRETPELRTIRRYIAACLLHGNKLQHPPLPENAPNTTGEVMFISDLCRAISNTLGEMWKHFETDPAACYARSEWLLSNLYLDIGSMRRMVFADGEQNDHYMMAVGISDLLMQFLHFATGVDDRRIREAYFDWLNQKHLQYRLNPDPGAIVTTAGLLKSTLLGVRNNMMEGPIEEADRTKITALLGLYYQEFPVVIREEMDKDDDFVAALRLDYTTAVNIGDLVIEADSFFKGASAAISGQLVKVPVLEPPTEIAFTLQDEHSQRSGLQFVHPLTQETVQIDNAELALLSDSASEREDVLRQNRYWFDCSHIEFEDIVAEIAAADSPRWRVEMAQKWLKSSAEVLYRKLISNLQTRQQFDVNELLPPDPDGLLRHLRLPLDAIDEPFEEILADAAKDLISTEGLSTALLRLAGMPTPIPEFLLNAVEVLPAVEKRSLIKQFLKQARSPIAKIHAIHLLNRIGENIPAFRRLARCIAISTLSERGQEEFQAFFTVAQWANEELGRQAKSKAWPTALRLAVVWSHAHRLQSIFVSMRAPTKWFQGFFGNLAQQKISLELFESNTQLWFDIAHPLRLKWLPFTLTGLMYGYRLDQSLIGDSLKEQILQAAFTRTEGVLMPTADLLVDSTLAGNTTASFLGNDNAEVLRILLDDEARDWFRYVQGQLLERQAANLRIADGIEWAHIGTLWGDLAPSPEWKDILQYSVEHTDFAELFAKNTLSGSIALLVSAQQVRHFNHGQIAKRLEEQLLRAVQKLADRQYLHQENTEQASTEDIHFLHLRLVEVALRLASVDRNSEEAVVAFSSLLERMVDILPSLLKPTEYMIQRFYQELPIAQARNFTRLYLLVRATE